MSILILLAMVALLLISLLFGALTLGCCNGIVDVLLTLAMWGLINGLLATGVYCQIGDMLR